MMVLAFVFMFGLLLGVGIGVVGMFLLTMWQITGKNESYYDKSAAVKGAKPHSPASQSLQPASRAGEPRPPGDVAVAGLSPTGAFELDETWKIKCNRCGEYYDPVDMGHVCKEVANASVAN
jgi:hypothetical protein